MNPKTSFWNMLTRAGGTRARNTTGVLRIQVARRLRVLTLAAASFTVNEIPVRAAALTFVTLLAFVPFAVILSSVAGKLGYLQLLSRLIPYLADSLNLSLPLDPVLRSIERAQRIGFHNLGLWGTGGLLFGFFLAMGNVESAVNRVWNVPGKRGWIRRFKAYTPFLFLLILMVVSGALLLLRARHGLEKWGFQGALPAWRFPWQSLFFGAAGILAFIWIELALMIYMLPNARVKAGPALFGATAATALIYFLSRLLFLFPSLLLAQNRFLYGSIAIFPVALLLVYVFWAAALFGAAVAFIHQRLYRGEDRERRATLESPGKAARPNNAWQEALCEVGEIYCGPKT
jgi:membrane protein